MAVALKAGASSVVVAGGLAGAGFLVSGSRTHQAGPKATEGGKDDNAGGSSNGCPGVGSPWWPSQGAQLQRAIPGAIRELQWERAGAAEGRSGAFRDCVQRTGRQYTALAIAYTTTFTTKNVAA